MSTKNHSISHRNIVTPIARLAGKQRVGKEDADDLSLPTMIYLDAAKRGACPHAGYNSLATTLLAAASIASQTKSKRFYDLVNGAYQMLVKAGLRPTALLDLTTTEYQAVRAAIAWYVRSLPIIEIGVLSRAYARAQAMMAH
ncbi:MAG: hypothetical protein ACXVCX_22075 [Ktedonobacterales bacterium]